MKPVSFCEIVVGQGEYLYRKGSNLIWTSAVLLVRSRHRVSGVRAIPLVIIGSLLCSIVAGWDSYPDTGMQSVFNAP